jgi:hypothetical protein
MIALICRLLYAQPRTRRRVTIVSTNSPVPIRVFLTRRPPSVR